MFSYNGSLYSVSWHFLTLTFAHGAPHMSHNWHTLSKVVFSTNKKSLYDTNQDTHKTKSHHTNLRWCVYTPTCVRTYHGTRRARHRRNKRKLPPNTLVRRELPQNHITIKMKYTQIQQNHITQMYVGARVLLRVCVPTMVKFPPKNGVTPKLPSEVAQCL